MSSKKDSILLIPGPEGWELWKDSDGAGYTRVLENGPILASGLEDIPQGTLLMAFPVRQLLATPFKVQTEDETMFADLASMHLEKSGIRPEQDAGQLTDVFSAGREDGQTSLLSVVLAAPAAEALPKHPPSGFDISARCYPMAANAVTLWQELGRWVFAVTSSGHLTYFQTLSAASLGAEVVRDIRLALAQLSLQGVHLGIEKAVVWKSGHDSDPADEEIQVFGEALGAEVALEPKPRPLLPELSSRLVPANVRAERRLQEEKRRRNQLIATLLLIYLAIAGYFAYDYFQLRGKLEKQKERLETVKVQHRAIGVFNEDWGQLSPMVDSRHWPLQLLYRAATIIPASQDLRFKDFSASRERIVIRGESGDVESAPDYAAKLRRDLSDYEWSLPPAEEDNKTSRWKFDYEGTLKGDGEE